MRDGCPFCAYAGPSPILHDTGTVIAFEPLNPVAEGHVLVVPRLHVEDFAASPEIAGLVAEVAGRLAREAGGDWNLIASKGEAATQTVRHLHLHLVPRVEGDGLMLPWSPRWSDEPGADGGWPCMCRYDGDGSLVGRPCEAHRRARAAMARLGIALLLGNDPTAGELRELLVAGGISDPDELRRAIAPKP